MEIEDSRARLHTHLTAAPARCGAAHVADARECEGLADAVRIVDTTGASTTGCLLHGAVLLASLVGDRVYSLHGPDGSAIEVHRRAQELPAFDFLTGRSTASSGEAPAPNAAGSGTERAA